jgi:hypothetical protein
MTAPGADRPAERGSAAVVGMRRAVRASAVAGGLSALVAGIAGLCCVGPLGIALLGVGGAVAAASLKPYRLPLLAVSFVLLTAAFWRTYRPRIVSTDVSCPIIAGRATRIGLWVAAVVWGTALVLYFVA